jgi:carbonic anhydrase/acetyltransferase-like protein (isoleucine patch superfamily)
MASRAADKSGSDQPKGNVPFPSFRRSRLARGLGIDTAKQQPRKQKKALKEAVRNRDPQAARLLLAHSVALGHGRLALRRYLAARYLGVTDLDEFRPFCRAVATRLEPQALLALAEEVRRSVDGTVDIHAGLSELIVMTDPLILPYAGTHPSFAGPPLYCGAQASLLGRLEIGAGAWFGPSAVVRGDGHFVRIGDDFRMSERATIHIAHDLYPVLVGDRVTVGANAIVHACTVGDDCVIEDGAVILDGSVLEAGVVLEAQATVFPRSELKSGWLHAGSPAKPVRELEPGEIERRRTRISTAIVASIAARAGRSWSRDVTTPADVFLAETSDVHGQVRIGETTGVFFGCQLIGGEAGVAIGADCNIQDNTIIDASNGAVSIGTGTTIGHNVDIRSGSIGSHSLIGIGCDLAEGTIVDDDVLLAGGATTLPGQHLESGWLWGGRPARKLAPLDAAKRTLIATTVPHYRAYAEGYIAAQLAAKDDTTG